MSERIGAALPRAIGRSGWVRPALLLTALSLLAGWAVVYLAPAPALALLSAAFGATIWLQAPGLAIYGLAGICPFDLSYQIGGLRDVRVQDAFLLALAVPALAALAAGSRRRLRFRSPAATLILGIWLFLLVWGSITFILGPANRWLLRGAAHNAWYVYQDIGRSMVLFPLVLLCLDTRRSVERTLDVLVLVAVGVALNAIWEARGSDTNATGHFGTTNALAGYLVLIIPFAAARLFMDDRWLARLLNAGALLVMLRALWLAGSRGGLVAFLASFAVLALLIPRRRAVAAAAAGALGLILVVVLRGGILEIPMMQRFMVLSNVSDVETFQWRQEQWGLFIQRIRERPWLGTGSDVDESLRELDRARTAHNAFLALSTKSGIPAAAAWGVLLVVVGVTAGLGLRRASGPRERVFWIGSLGFLMALVVHNLVETTLVTIVTQHLFWIVTASALLMACPEEQPIDSPPAGAGAPGILRP